MADDNVNSLRADIARMRKAVTRKISRLKQSHDVVVSGTHYDPRRAARSEDRFNESQLVSYKNSLGAFLDRGNQYVPDANNKPLPRDEFREYKRLETEYNRNVNEYFAKMQDVKLPNGETIRERMARFTPDHRQMGNVNVNAPYQPPSRDSTNINGLTGLQKLTADMRKRLTENYFTRINEESRKQFKQMAELLNSPKLARTIEGLKDEQFAALWNYTPFATSVSILYETQLKLLSDKESPYNTDVFDNAVNTANELANWARTLKISR